MSSSSGGGNRAAPPFVIVVGLAFALPLGGPPPASGYQFLRGPEFVWPSGSHPLRYWVADRPDNWMDVDEVVAETRAAFDTWEAPPQVGFSFSYQGKTGLRPFDFFDATNTIGFSTREHLAELGLSETTLGVTSWLIDGRTGAIAESDILVNPAYNWTDTPERGGWDYRSLIVHEIGHFIGLGHSNVGRYSGDALLKGTAVMWPFSFGPAMTVGRTLTADDIAGASVLYPGPSANTGRIAGAVLRSNGDRVAFAHVVAFEPTQGHTVGAWANGNGDYEIGGLFEGRYVLRVNPLPDEHAASRYFFREREVDTDFRVTVLPRFVIVSRNGVAEVDIEVSQ